MTAIDEIRAANSQLTPSRNDAATIADLRSQLADVTKERDELRIESDSYCKRLIVAQCMRSERDEAVLYLRQYLEGECDENSIDIDVTAFLARIDAHLFGTIDETKGG